MLFTTIATVLVVVVALTTATFAWFSAADTATASSEFTAQAISSKYSFFKWSSGANSPEVITGDWSVAATSVINFASEDGSLAIDPKNQETAPTDEGGNFAYWNTEEIKPMMPTSQILDASTDSGRFDETSGIPVSAFKTAVSNDNGATLEQVGDIQANRARFKIRSNNTNSNFQIKVEFSTTDSQDSRAAQMLKSMRFLVVGKALDKETIGTSDNGYANFVFGTQYSYVENPTNKAAPSYKAASYEGTQVLLIENKESIETIASNQKITYTMNTTTLAARDVENASATFTLPNTASYEIVIYVWFDGQSANEASALKAISMNIEFGAAA